jgi:flavorubredoxin
MYPSVADLLTYLKGLRPQNLVGAAFGSYGWSGEAVGQVREILQAMNVELVGDGLRVTYVPGSEALQQSYELGRRVAERMKEKVGRG